MPCISPSLQISRNRAAQRCLPGLMVLVLWVAGGQHVFGAEFDTAERQFLSGQYSEAIRLAQSAVEEGTATESWHGLLIRGLLETGQYPDALVAATNAVALYPRSLVLRWLSREALLNNGQPEAAALMAREIAIRAITERRTYRDTPDLIVVGRALLLQRVDPKQVLNQLYEPARREDPTDREVYLAGGALALDKGDYALAAEWFRDGLNQLPEDPDLHFGLAQAYLPSEPALAMESLQTALGINSNHIDCLLLLADRKIDAEAYEDAEKLLETALRVNPSHPEALAYRAVIAHLQNEPEQEREARSMALKYWPTNPRVDHLMGLKLSQKYRFREGSGHQVQALQFDGNYQPALLQLAQDWLRLGLEKEGWELARQVQAMDEYNVTANNLVALEDVIEAFQTVTNDHFVLRMEPLEARVYGRQALNLLEQARTELCGKYGFQLIQPTTVEIFHRQGDFAVRTFGMPENDGFLGVCFGHVITANSPSSRAGQAFNWQSMLWHEFCHVVTLQLTGNKIPRWLSEGISVYEERQANPSWGEQISPAYREMLLDESLTPVSNLSAAFLMPKSGLHLQFAYYQSSLVVEFLINEYGYDTLLALLRELGKGTHINEALEQHAAPMNELEPAFVEFAHQTALNLAPALDWEKPDLESLMASIHASETNEYNLINAAGGLSPASDAWATWAKEHPTNFYVMTRQAVQLTRQEQWSEAQPILEQLVTLFPEFVGPSSAYAALADVYREMGDAAAEKRTLEAYAEREDEAADVYLRLMEMVTAEADWPSVIENANRYLAVNPLVPPPYRYLAKASEALGENQQAIDAYRAQLELDPINPAELSFRLARLLYQAGDPAARQYLLEALEDAPRHREALELLLQMNASDPAVSASGGSGSRT